MIVSKLLSPRWLYVVILTVVVLGCTTQPKPLLVTTPIKSFSQTPGTLPPKVTRTSEATTKIIETQSTISNTWRTISGVQSGINQIRTLLYASDGSLWAGGPSSLINWNLQNNQSTVYVFDAQNTNYEAKVVDLAESSDKSLWVATFGYGLSRFDGRKWDTFTLHKGLPSNYISSLAVTRDGKLWLDTSSYARDEGRIKGGFLMQYDGKNWSTILSGSSFYKIVAAPDTSIWTLSNWDLNPLHYTWTAKYDGIKWQDITVKDVLITALGVAPNGIVWVSSDNGVFRYQNNVWQNVPIPWISQTHASVTSIAISSKGIAWFGFSNTNLDDVYKCGDRIASNEEFGIYRYDGTKWTHFTEIDGLVDNKVCAITIDNKDRVWIGTYDKGISMFDGQKWQSYIVK